MLLKQPLYNNYFNKKNKHLSDVHSNKTLSETYQILLEQVGAFVVFVEANGLDYDL
jgi:hypothetical protein